MVLDKLVKVQVQEFVSPQSDNLPNYHNKEIQSVPFILQVTLFANNSHCYHFDHHLSAKESEDEMFDVLQHSTAGCSAIFVLRLVHGQCHTVDEDYKHANSLKPCKEKLKKIWQNIVFTQEIQKHPTSCRANNVCMRLFKPVGSSQQTYNAIVLGGVMAAWQSDLNFQLSQWPIFEHYALVSGKPRTPIPGE